MTFVGVWRGLCPGDEVLQQVPICLRLATFTYKAFPPMLYLFKYLRWRESNDLKARRQIFVGTSVDAVQAFACQEDPPSLCFPKILWHPSRPRIGRPNAQWHGI